MKPLMSRVFPFNFMDEIKFRSWDKKTNQIIKWQEIKRWNIGVAFSKKDLKDFPIMQYTGIKDRNGKEIYEGDILIHPSGQTAEVAWHTMYPALTLYEDSNTNKFDLRDIWEDEDSGSQFEIIGNIYQNPKLAPKL